ncbi:4-hydroxy-3-methylbut-2-enyl diphosphate reductase [Gaoshiqia sediminis]|uniref:4-hydroxy-3-methylbut-2-enyl diphosphate reductase n=1 Tax=Gaoshiqia sediminis TaxID=2986998 RepID=A0AA41Y6V9_9BACT|nr:4-hydroxy-3-methylbut-2-enyl diphosphate reductase [Gaoshiqia sediminis]MCW0482561.1 4-hydroxy-3-methylbut-2-enyl diphosphate reductase [Gaoshiqia sediminis]
MKVEIDQKSGFCFGVVNAVSKAEEALQSNDKLYCLGDIVHNGMEVSRLETLGLITIDHKKYFTLKDCKVLLRTHGEPPSTYEYARENNIELIDATCPVVLKLQQRVRRAHEDMQQQQGQVIIFGKKGHAEVKGLLGQTGNRAILVENEADLEQIDPQKPLVMFSQTTKPLDDFHRLSAKIQERAQAPTDIKDTICRQVANRVPRLKIFAAGHDVMIFVGGRKSSNAKLLFAVCQQANPNSYFISGKEELDTNWFTGHNSVGISGATSTPQWLMEEIAEIIRKI